MLKVSTFFQNKNFLNLFRWRKKCTFDMAGTQLSPKDRKSFGEIGNGWRIERKILKPNVFPRKDCLAHRVQFCKPCRTKISQKWSWINQNTKNTQKSTIFNRKNYPENVAWTPKNNFDNCDEVSGRNSRGFSFKVRNW